MKQETQNFLDFVDREFNPGSITIEKWKYYLDKLPHIYKSDITFRLLFDWHWDLNSGIGRACFRNPEICAEDPIFTKQIQLITTAGSQLWTINTWWLNTMKSTYEESLYWNRRLTITIYFSTTSEWVIYQYNHPTHWSRVRLAYSTKHGNHEKRKTIYCNAEEIHEKVTPGSIDSIFSVACFEHIYDLPMALEACYTCSKKGATLFSFFAPIYSRIDEGDHGVIPQHEKFAVKPIGLHLLSSEDQDRNWSARNADPKEIQNSQ